MKIISTTPQESLDKALLRFRPKEADFERFKTKLGEFQTHIDNEQREDQQKTYVQNFLREAIYPANNVNSKGTIDLAIHSGPDAASCVLVMIEAKAPGNKAQMVSRDRPNAKALHELVLYFMRERVDEDNDDLKYLIATNINEWFIFAASDFNKIFYANTKFRKTYEDWRDKLKVSANTDHFYDEIVKPFIDQLDITVECTYFDLREYKAPVTTVPGSDKTHGVRKLIALYKLLSPYHLLKTKFEDDSNTLDKKFYTELLHIIGLEEYKEKSKTLIRRKTTDNIGSLMEMAITMLEVKDVLPRVENPSAYGDTREKRYEAIALELCITWINRILFLKLLEAQLAGYHGGDSAYRFLNLEMVRDFDELFALFHQVLAKTTDERPPAIREKFARVPYLNSSLFETTDLENQTITIESLKDHELLPVIGTSILKKLKEKADGLKTLEYLFRFLDAYDFASEGKDDIQSENRSLINASVLGKVFEKINGYKDGSIYTPGFITMYMCRQAIRLAVVQKFRDETDFNGTDFGELKNWIKDDRSYQKDNIKRFNEIIDSLKICDPAVGSGHFLVSALNEILAIKSELRIFADDQYETFGDYSIAIVNDELIIVHREKNTVFEYKIHDGKPLNAEMQRLQRALFHEKQKLIENCLFGVDINPNSVKICRLRLWIELLKNAYYKFEVPPLGGLPRGEEPPKGGTPNELETLPNIDINIKEGNSLVSRFALDADLADVLKQVNLSIDDYRALVTGYKETRDREAKRGFETQIKKLKEDFKIQLFHFSPERKKRREISGDLERLKNQPRMFEESEEINKKEASTIAKLEKDLAAADAAIKSVEENVIFEKAFEWRFEFPEVLDASGKFLGFDVVIGNPPYISNWDLSETDRGIVEFLEKEYNSYLTGHWDAFCCFVVRGFELLKANSLNSFILPTSFFKEKHSSKLRKHLVESLEILELIDFQEEVTFQDIARQTGIYLLRNRCLPTNEILIKRSIENEGRLVPQSFFKKLKNHAFKTNVSHIDTEIFDKLITNSELLGTFVCINTGVVAHSKIDSPLKFTKDDVIRKFPENQVEEGFKKYIVGSNISRYSIKFEYDYIDYDSKREHFHRSKYPLLFESDKIVVRRISGKHNSFMACFDDCGYYTNDNVMHLVSWNAEILTFQTPEKKWDYKIDSNINLRFILAILNSRLNTYYFSRFLSTDKLQGSYSSIYPEDIRQIPIKKISPTEQTPFIALVDQILDLKTSGGDTTALERQIDEMVYKLYDLTPEEIAIVEGN